MSYYLFVDSLKPIELLVCFSALVRWGESGGKRLLRVPSSECPEHGWAREHVTIRLSVHRAWNYLFAVCQELQGTAPATTFIALAPPTPGTLPPILSWSQSLVQVFGMLCLAFLFASTCHHSYFPCYFIWQWSEMIFSFSSFWVLLWLVVPCSSVWWCSVREIFLG